MRRLPILSPDGEGGGAGAGPATPPNNAPDERLAAAQAQAAAALARYRELVATSPGLVAEMVQGSTIEEIDASVEVARQAYANVSRRIAGQYEQAVPPGNPARSSSTAGAEALKPEAKIALGLRGR